MVCPHCGANNDSTAAFCYNCGTRLEQQPSAAGSPTIRIQPDELPFAPPTLAAPSLDAPNPAPNPAPFSLPSAQLPASPYGAPPLGVPGVVPNSTAAIISLVFGIVSWFALPVIGAIVAIVAGHMARAEIGRSGGAVGGRGMATAGLILGYAHVALLLIGGCLLVALLLGIGFSASQ